jgi:hypothetical protein
MDCRAMTVVLIGLTERQPQSWLGLLDVAADFPDGWCLVGGQMVYLYCQERGFSPSRPTNDGDVVLDVRAKPNVLRDFTQALAFVGFTSAGVSPEGHQHRWVRDRASIDVLIPQGLGGAAGSRTGITGGTTLATPGAQQAINRSEPVTVQVDEAVGTIRRPIMLGALVAKAAAFSVPSDPAKERHLSDFATLAAMIRGSDRIGQQLTTRDRHYLIPMLKALDNSRRLWASIEGAERGVVALAAITATTSQATVIAPPLPSAAPEPPVPDL